MNCPVWKEKIGTETGALGVRSKGASDHQFYNKCFSDLSLSLGISGASLTERLIGSMNLLSLES